jgi:hypothetical protein
MRELTDDNDRVIFGGRELGSTTRKNIQVRDHKGHFYSKHKLFFLKRHPRSKHIDPDQQLPPY